MAAINSMITKFSTSNIDDTYLIKGKNGNYFQCSASTYFLLEEIEQGATFEELSLAISAQGQNVSAFDLENAYRKIQERIDIFNQEEALKKVGFWFRIPVISKRFVQPISRSFFAAYTTIGATLMGLLIIGGLIIVANDYQALRTQAVGANLWIGYILFHISTIFHEFGHTTACKRYGAEPGEIGCGIYLIYPMLYSDVTSAWELQRWQRVIVDCGGIYFQLIIASLYAIAYSFSHWEPLMPAILMIGLNCVFSLNPIFKFDGYWMVADALGIANLTSQTRRIIAHYVRKLRGKDVSPLPWKTYTIVLLTIYSVISIGFWLWLIFFSLPVLASNIAQYPSISGAFIDEVFFHHVITSDKIFSFLSTTYVVLLAALILYQHGKPWILRTFYFLQRRLS